MRQPGRKASAVRAVVIEGGFAARLEPPAELNRRQAELWRIVTATEDPDFFATGATRGLLADYCRRRETAEKLTVAIEEFKPEWLKDADGVRRYKYLLQMRDMELRGMVSLATKLRITNQSRYHEQNAATKSHAALAKVAKPWEV